MSEADMRAYAFDGTTEGVAEFLEHLAQRVRQHALARGQVEEHYESPTPLEMAYGLGASRLSRTVLTIEW